MAEWRTLPLGEIAHIVTGTTPKAGHSDDWGDTIDFLTPSDQIEGQRIVMPSRRLSAKGAERYRNRIVPAGSTALTCIGATIGKTSLTGGPTLTNQQINSLVPKAEFTDPKYLYYMILHWSPQLHLHASGSATPIVNKSTLSGFDFSIPPLAAQQAVGEVLGALDDKIAANRELIQRADNLARITFKRALVGSATSVRPLSSFADFINGRAFTKNASGTGRVVIRIAELNSGLGGSTVYNDIDVPDQHLARPGDILFAWSGSLTMHRWYRPEAIVNQHIFKVVPNEGNPPWLVWQLIAQKLEEFRAIAADKATTMGHIRRRDLDEPVVAPSETSIRDHHELMAGLWSRALAAEQESLTLAATRDALLPALMSGRLRVKDAERQVEAVV